MLDLSPANGGKGGDGDTAANNGAGGGGGSGGIVYLSAPSLSVADGAIVSAIGGEGGSCGAPPCTAGGPGGAGGLGRIRLSLTPSSSTLAPSAFTPPLANGTAPSNQQGVTFVAQWPK